MKHTYPSILALAVATAGLAATPALAQDLNRGETVLDRPRPEVEQLGVRAGSFVFLPRIEAGGTYDSNVFATQDNTKHDFIFVTRPQVDVRSDWNNHALNFSAGAELARYRDYSRLDYTDYRVATNGRVDVTRDTQLLGGLYHRRLHEGVGEPDVPGNVSEPIIYRNTGGDAAIQHRFNRVRARLGGTVQYYDYDDAELLGGGVARQDDRNRWEYAGTLRVGYEFMDGYEAFVQGGLGRINYRRAVDYSGRDRDSRNYEVVAGARVDLTGVITGEFYAGYMKRDYEDAALKDFGGLALGGQVNWAVTQLTTVTGRVTRQIRETSTTLGGVRASSYTRTLFALGVDHELLRSLMLNGRAQYRQDDFKGIERTDNVYTLGLGATYNFTRNLYLTGGYTFETRRSDVADDYKDNLFVLRLGAQL